MTALIDTCILVDALQSRKPFSDTAEKIILGIANQLCSGVITAKSVCDIYYLMHCFTHSDAETREILKRISTLFLILDTTGIDCRRAMVSDVADFEDAVMLETAYRTGVDCIVTRNTKDYTRAGIPVYTPDAFLELLCD